MRTETLSISYADLGDPPASSEGLDRHFRNYERVVLDGVGHFPHREAPAQVAALVRRHLDTHRA